MEVAELPEDSWTSLPVLPCSFEIEGDSAALQVLYQQSNGYVGARVHMWLTPAGVEATAKTSSCTGGWFGQQLAGTATLVTNGQSAVLDFEIHDGGSDRFPRSVSGRALLDGRGAELARLALASQRPDELRRERFEYTEVTDRTTKREAFGSVDGFGRRQGLWTVREVGEKEPILEATWRDGIPHGLYRQRRSDVLVIGTMDAGCMEGEQVVWFSDGERQVSQYRQGSRHGRSTTYDRDGFVTRVSEEQATLDPTCSRVSDLYTRR